MRPIDADALIVTIERMVRHQIDADDICEMIQNFQPIELERKEGYQLPSAQPEAKLPKWIAEDRYAKNRFAVFPHCPRCNAGVTTGQCYCMICGQHIDWSEDDG